MHCTAVECSYANCEVLTIGHVILTISQKLCCNFIHSIFWKLRVMCTMHLSFLMWSYSTHDTMCFQTGWEDSREVYTLDIELYFLVSNPDPTINDHPGSELSVCRGIKVCTVPQEDVNQEDPFASNGRWWMLQILQCTFRRGGELSLTSCCQHYLPAWTAGSKWPGFLGGPWHHVARSWCCTIMVLHYLGVALSC